MPQGATLARHVRKVSRLTACGLSILSCPGRWLASPENPYFATNLANIVWAQFFGKGIIDPVDDVRISNPASNPELLEELGKRFTAYKYDFKKLVRDICTSRTYQLATEPNPSNEGDTKNFAKKGAIVGDVPTGTGVMVMANRDIHVFDNEIDQNQTAAVMVVSYTQNYDDLTYNPLPRDIVVRDNRIGKNGWAPQFPGGEVLVVVEQELHLAQCLPVPGRPAHARLELTGDAAHQEPGDCGVFLDHRRRPRGPVTQVTADRVRQRVEVPDHRLQRADIERGQGRGVVCLVGHRP